MPDNVTEVTPQSEIVSTNWDALEKDYSSTPLTQEKPAEKTEVPATEEKTVVDDIANPPKTEDAKTEPTAEEKLKLETEAFEKDKKDLGLAETATKEEVAAAKALKSETPKIEFKVEEILPKGSELAEEGTWIRVAQDLKIDGVTEDTFDAFKAALEKPLIEKIQTLETNSKVDYLATLKPETATALKLMEMGIKEEELFAPTREIDNYLTLENAALVRADLEASGWKVEMIDAEMELLTSKNLIDHQADKIRLTLNETKTEIVNNRNQLLQQFETQKEAAVLKQKEQEDIQFEQTLNTVSKFMDVDIKPEIKQAIITKYRNGGYDNDFKTAKTKVDYVLNKELGQQLIKSIRNTEFQKGQETVTKKLLEVPPLLNGGAGSKVDLSKQLTNNDNWAAIEKDFGNK